MHPPPLTLKIFRYPIHSFHFFGATGFFLGLIVGMSLAYCTGLAIWPVWVCSLTGAGVLFGLTYLYKTLTGREDLVYYQHEIAILLCCVLVLYLLQQPILQYIDITLMGIGIFLVLGRIGCFSVGCCHGKPNKKYGVIYTQVHVAEGFPAYYAGIPIFPIQLVESIGVLGTVLLGIYAILSGAAPGTALLIYTVAYGWVRFCLEFYRGDAARPYWLGFSEAQWTTFGVFIASGILSWTGLLPQYGWHLGAVAGLMVGMLALAIVRQWKPAASQALLRPKHIAEVAHGIAALDDHLADPGQVLIACTSLDLNISKGESRLAAGTAVHYTISGGNTSLENRKARGIVVNTTTAAQIGKLIQILRHPKERLEIMEEQPGIFHLVFTKN